MSEKINEILYDALFKKKKSLFGTMKEADISDLRDHEDRMSGEIARLAEILK